MVTRHAAVANQFYNGDAQKLEEQLDSFFVPVDDKVTALAVVSPHAGYVYSGKVAGAVFSRISPSSVYIILGPNHRGYGSSAAIMTDGEWKMPWGMVPLNREVGQSLLQKSPLLRDDEVPHQLEHSCEVQVPFIHRVSPQASIVPITLSIRDYAACDELGKAIAATIRSQTETVTIVASTDMSHYEPYQVAKRKDRPAIDAIEALDPATLYSYVIKNRVTMCGVIPTVISLIAALDLGATHAELVDYRTSGETSGDFQQVVGYAGLIVT